MAIQRAGRTIPVLPLPVLAVSALAAAVAFLVVPTAEAQDVQVLQPVQQLHHADGAANESLGGRTEISGDLLILGSDQYHDVDDMGGTLAWIFERDPDDGLFKEVSRIELPVAVDDDFRLGQWVDVDNQTKTAIVGSPRTFVSPGDGGLVGVAIVFEQDENGDFVQGAVLSPNDGVSGARFGATVAINDGTALVGAPYMYCEGEGGGFNNTWVETVFYDSVDYDYPTADEWAEGAQLCGAVYVFEQDAGGNWSQTAKLTTSDISPGDRLGYGAKLSGDTAILSAPGEDGNRGAAYVFERGPDGVWTEQHKFAHNYATEGQTLGHWGEIIDFDHETMVFSTVWINSTHVFQKQGTAWPETETIPKPEGLDGWFASAASVSGDWALFDSSFSPKYESAYLYHRSCGNWTLVATLEVPQDLEGDPAALRRAMLSGDTAVISIPASHHNGLEDHGTAFIYELPPLVNECAVCEEQEAALTTELASMQVAARAASAPSEPAQLNGDQLLHAEGEANDNFGRATAMSGDYALVGGWGADNGTGAAWVFERQPSGEWAQVASLQHSDAQDEDRFGLYLDISGDTALVGAPRSDLNASVPDVGAVYAYTRDPSTGEWSETAKLQPDDLKAGGLFGHDTSIDGDTAVIGAGWHPCEGFEVNETEGAEGQACGAAYVFERDSAGAWTQTAKLQPKELPVAGDGFGLVTAVSGDTAMVASSLHRDGRGAVYVFERQSTGEWLATDKLLHSYGTSAAGRFSEVVLDGDTAVIVSIGAGDGFGAGIVFVRAGSTWSEQTMLVPASPTLGQVVISAALDGDLVVLGAPMMVSPDGPDGVTDGAAFAFHRSCGLWTQIATMGVADGVHDGQFGRNVAASGDTVMVGAPKFNHSPDEGNSTSLEAHGAVYAFNDLALPSDACASDCNASVAASVKVVSPRTLADCQGRVAELECDLAALQ